MNHYKRACHQLEGPNCEHLDIRPGYWCSNTKCCEQHNTNEANNIDCQCYLPVPLPRDYRRFTRRVLSAYCFAVAGAVTMYFGSLIILRIVTFLTTL